MPSTVGTQQFLLITGTSTVCLAASAMWLYWRRLIRAKNVNEVDDEKYGNEKAENQKKCVQMQPELWADIVDWLPASVLAQGLSLANRQLHQICAPKMYEQGPHVVNALGIDRDNENNNDNDTDDAEEEEEESEHVPLPAELFPTGSNITGKKEKKKKNKSKEDEEYEKRKKANIKIRKRLWDSDFSECRDFPAPEVEPTPNILGFRKINFRIINDRALAFLRNIRCKFADNSVPMSLEPCGGSECSFQELLEFHDILMGKVVSLYVDEASFYDLYWKHCRPFLMSLQFLTFDGSSYRDEYLDIQCVWLQSPREDGQPRYFFDEFREIFIPFIQRLREQFLAPRNSCTYIVEFDLIYLQPTDEQPPEPFSLQNDLNERLVLGRHGRVGGGEHQMLVLRRFPAMAATMTDDWMQPHLDKARKLFFHHVRLFRRFRTDPRDNDVTEEEALNEVALMLIRVSGP